MIDLLRYLPSDELLEILTRFGHIRDAVRGLDIPHRDAVLMEIVEGEKSAARLLGMLSGKAS